MSPQPYAPGYWMHETGGELAPAIRRYLEGQPLSVHEITLIRLYIQQWIDAGVWDCNPDQSEEGREGLAGLRQMARVLSNRESIEAWIELATDFGIDPL